MTGPFTTNAPTAEVDITPDLVRSLLAEQHPDLAGRSLTAFAAGWDNEHYRLGEDLLVRLPRRRASARLIENEQRWLPSLQPHLPVPVPVPVRVGRPGPGFPWAWSIVPWLEGRSLLDRPPTDRSSFVTQLCTFLTHLHRPASPEAPRNPVRGVPLVDRDRRTLDAGDRAGGVVGHLDELLARWRDAVDAPPHDGPARWLHGDLHPGNILWHDSRITGIVDWGDITAGDPSCDYWVAWAFLEPAERQRFRRRLAIDDAAWRRSRGWAITIGLALVTMTDDQPLYNRLGHRALREVLTDP